MDHLFAECPAYEQFRDGVRKDFKEVLGEDEIREIISSYDNGLGFFMSLVEKGSLQVIKITKVFLSKIWRIRDVFTATSNQVSQVVD